MIVERIEKLLSKYTKLFLEQDVDDLGEVPSTVIRSDEPSTAQIISAIDNDVVKKSWEELKKKIATALDGVEVSEVDDEEFALLIGDVVVRFLVTEGEPMVVFRKSNGERITVSLTLILGSVIDEAELIERLIEDDELIKEFLSMYAQITGNVEEQFYKEDQEEEVTKGEEDVEKEGTEEETTEEQKNLTNNEVNQQKEEVYKRLKKTEKVIKDLKEKLNDIVTVKVADDSVKFSVNKDILPDSGTIAKKALQRMNLPDLSKKISKAPNVNYPDILGFYTGGKIK